MKSNLLVSAIMGMIPHQKLLQKLLQNFLSTSARKQTKNWSGVFNGKRECTRRQKQMAAKAAR